MFEPNLPSDKVDAINTLGFGIVDKVFVIEEALETSNSTDWGTVNMLWMNEDGSISKSKHTNPGRDDHKESASDADCIQLPSWCEDIYEFQFDRTSGTRVGWISGPSAIEMEHCSDATITSEIRKMYNAFGLDASGES